MEFLREIQPIYKERQKKATTLNIGPKIRSDFNPSKSTRSFTFIGNSHSIGSKEVDVYGKIISESMNTINKVNLSHGDNKQYSGLETSWKDILTHLKSEKRRIISRGNCIDQIQECLNLK